MLDFWKSLSHQLIENEYFDQEAESQHHRSSRIQEGIGHGLMSLPPYRKILGGRMVPSDSKYPPKNADLLQMHSSNRNLSMIEFLGLVVVMSVAKSD